MSHTSVPAFEPRTDDRDPEEKVRADRGIRAQRLGELTSTDLLRMVLNFPWLSHAAHYNLACFYSRQAKQRTGREQSDGFENCLRELEAALDVDATLAAWAGSADPALQEIRTNVPYGRRFDRLIAQYEPESRVFSLPEPSPAPDQEPQRLRS
jgi:hypothetical protein